MYSVWFFVAGLGLFLYAMWLLEDSLRSLAGRTFKLFLRRNTSTRLGAMGSGALVTGILQSSSVVTLMTLAFVGAGIINMRNALAVVLGANFGTTLDSWIVATLGFKFNIESFTLPIIGVAALSLLLFEKNKRLFHFSRFLLGFGFIFLGLGFMKDSMKGLLEQIDLSNFIQYPPIVFVVLGFIITALIQSSSATIAITLSALATTAIPYEKAVPIVIGSELGTTVKIVMGSIGGIPAKKRVALGNVLFNLIVTLVALLTMKLLINLIRSVIGVSDPLMALVLFQSLINLIGIILFFPFMGLFTNFLESKFKESEARNTFFIQHVSPRETEEAYETLYKEVNLFLLRIIRLNMFAFKLKPPALDFSNDIAKQLLQSEMHHQNFNSRYNSMKEAEGEILSYYYQVAEIIKQKEILEKFNSLLGIVRQAISSAKNMKDILHNRSDFKESVNDKIFAFYETFKEQLLEIYPEINTYFNEATSDTSTESYEKIKKKFNIHYEKNIASIYSAAGSKDLEQRDLSSLLNVNHEIHHAASSIADSIFHFKQLEQIQF